MVEVTGQSLLDSVRRKGVIMVMKQFVHSIVVIKSSISSHAVSTLPPFTLFSQSASVHNLSS